MTTQENSGIMISGYWEAKQSTSWVAEIPGWEKNEKGFTKLSRKFIAESSLQWLGKKSEKRPRGIKTWKLNDGLYEICRYESEKHYEIGEEGGERYFARVVSGQVNKISQEALEAQLTLNSKIKCI